MGVALGEEITRTCERCGDEFSYRKKKGRPRKLCDNCGQVRLPSHTTTYDVPDDFHVHLQQQDKEKLQFLVDYYGSGRIETIRTTIRITHALALRDMSRG